MAACGLVEATCQTDGNKSSISIDQITEGGRQFLRAFDQDFFPIEAEEMEPGH